MSSVADKNNCRKCGEERISKKQGLTCGMCNSWWHFKCMKGISMDIMGMEGDIMRIFGERAYLCIICKTNKHKRENTVNPLTESITLESRVKNLEEGMRQVAIGKKMAGERRTDRKENILVHGAAECESANMEEQRAHDEELIANLLRTIKIEETDEIDDLWRIGERKEGKMRPIGIRITDEQTRHKILENARFLARNDEWFKVYLTKDRTPRERLERKLSRAQPKRNEAKEEPEGSGRQRQPLTLGHFL